MSGRLDDPVLQRLRAANPVDRASVVDEVRDHPARTPQTQDPVDRAPAWRRGTPGGDTTRHRPGGRVPRLAAALLVAAVVAAGVVTLAGISHRLPPTVTDPPAGTVFQWTLADSMPGTGMSATFAPGSAWFDYKYSQPLPAAPAAPELGQVELAFDQMLIIGEQWWIHAWRGEPTEPAPADARWYRAGPDVVGVRLFQPIDPSEAALPTFPGAAEFRRVASGTPDGQVRYRADAAEADLSFLNAFAPPRNALFGDEQVDVWVDGDDRVRRVRMAGYEMTFDPVDSADAQPPAEVLDGPLPTIVDHSGVRITMCADAAPDDLAAARAALRADPAVISVDVLDGATPTLWARVRWDADLLAVERHHRGLAGACTGEPMPGVAVVDG